MNAQEVNINGKTYVFVSRGIPISKEEISEFFNSNSNVEVKQFIPDNRDRKRIFLKDLKNGAKWCASKYGVTQSDVIEEAKRLAPHLKVV